MSYVKVKEAYDARRSAVEELRTLADEIGNNEETEEQRAKFDKLDADITKYDNEITRWIKEGQLNERSAELDALIGKQADEGQRDERGETPIEKEARALFGLSIGQATDVRATPEDLSVLARREMRGQTTDILAGTATDGAELVPTTLFGQLYVALREGATSMFTLGRSVITASGEPMNMPRVTEFSAATLVSEAGAIGENTPQFGTVTLNSYKYGLAVQISSEFERDEAVPGAIPWIVEQAADGIRRGVGAALITGDGSSKPNGVDNGSTTSTATGVTFPTGDNLVDAYHAIASPYRQDAVWVFNDATIAGIRKLKDGNSQYLWQPGLTAGMPDTLLGKPVYTDSSLATVGANAKIGLFGDLKRGYVVRTVGNVRAERSVEYAFLNDLITWRFLGSFDGEIIDNTAYTVITNEAA